MSFINRYERRPGESAPEHLKRLKDSLLECAARDLDDDERIIQGTAVPLSLLEQIAIYRPEIWDQMRGHARLEHEPPFSLTPENVLASKRISELIKKKKGIKP